MADTVESLEQEVAASRARLADTLDRLTSSETSEAVKRDLIDTLNKTKDDVLNRARDTGRQKAQSLTDTLKQRAMDNPFAVALIGAGIAYRLYKKPPVTTLLVGAGLASLMMSGGSGRSAAGRPARTALERGYVPGGVAGYGYPVEEDAPTPSTLERVGAAASSVAERARDIGESARGTASATAHQVLDTARDVGERARDQASATAARVSDTVSGAAAQVSETAATVASQVSDAVAGATAQVSETASRAREALSGAVEQTTSHVTEAGHNVADTTHEMADRAIAFLDRAQRKPVVLGAAGFAAGFAIARSVRATETGERVLDYATDTVAVGARQVASGVSRAAAHAADTAGSLAAIGGRGSRNHSAADARSSRQRGGIRGVGHLGSRFFDL